VRYPELKKYLERGAGPPTRSPGGLENPPHDLKNVREAVIAIRKRKGMVLDPGDPDTRSDGSFFMNPVISEAEYADFANLQPDAPHFPADGGMVKLSAAWLIEHAGFQKGHVYGNVGLSTKHTLALVNRGGGTAAEVVEFVQQIQERVRVAFGVEIHPEPNFVGFARLGDTHQDSHGTQ